MGGHAQCISTWNDVSIMSLSGISVILSLLYFWKGFVLYEGTNTEHLSCGVALEHSRWCSSHRLVMRRLRRSILKE